MKELYGVLFHAEIHVLNRKSHGLVLKSQILWERIDNNSKGEAVVPLQVLPYLFRTEDLKTIESPCVTAVLALPFLHKLVRLFNRLRQ